MRYEVLVGTTRSRGRHLQAGDIRIVTLSISDKDQEARIKGHMVIFNGLHACVCFVCLMLPCCSTFAPLQLLHCIAHAHAQARSRWRGRVESDLVQRGRLALAHETLAFAIHGLNDPGGDLAVLGAGVGTRVVEVEGGELGRDGFRGSPFS